MLSFTPLPGVMLQGSGNLTRKTVNLVYSSTSLVGCYPVHISNHTWPHSAPKKRILSMLLQKPPKSDVCLTLEKTTPCSRVSCPLLRGLSLTLCCKHANICPFKWQPWKKWTVKERRLLDLLGCVKTTIDLYGCSSPESDWVRLRLGWLLFTISHAGTTPW